MAAILTTALGPHGVTVALTEEQDPTRDPVAEAKARFDELTQEWKDICRAREKAWAEWKRLEGAAVVNRPPVFECPKCRSRAYGAGFCYCRKPSVAMVPVKG